MRVLVAIPHYHRASGVSAEGRVHGSLRDAPGRVHSLTACLSSLRQLFGRQQCVFDIAGRTTRPANTLTADTLDVVACTTGDDHLLRELNLPPGFFEHRATDAQPLLLGFECHAVLRERLGRYDYYCYLEDDLIVRDPWLFVKLAWFNRDAGDECLLQPNRFEVAANAVAHKAYIDGDLVGRATAAFQDVTAAPRLRGEALGQRLEFVRPSNPHSGCFFLNARQMERWAASPWFLDRDTRFVGALESAATLGIMRTFRVYKAAERCAAFFEVEHAGTAFLAKVRAP